MEEFSDPQYSHYFFTAPDLQSKRAKQMEKKAMDYGSRRVIYNILRHFHCLKPDQFNSKNTWTAILNAAKDREVCYLTSLYPV